MSLSFSELIRSAFSVRRGDGSIPPPAAPRPGLCARLRTGHRHSSRGFKPRARRREAHPQIPALFVVIFQAGMSKASYSEVH